MTMKLNDANLTTLPHSIKRPTYDRSALKPGIVHIGVGNFHRAHQAWYLHRLFCLGLAHDWAIIGAGVRPYDEAMRVKLADQDYLTALISLDPEGSKVDVIGSMIDYVPIEAEHSLFVDQMANPAIRIVSLTVTEGGYYVDPVTGQFDVSHADLQHDAEHPDHPLTAFGAIVRALKLRRDAHQKPFTCLSCDNLQGNGEILRQTIVGLARQSDAALASWIAENGAFPNSMVDCIVPATGLKEVDLAMCLGVADEVPVTHENFRQWVIEDSFCAGRPDWDKVGATFVTNVHDYEMQKIRLLNAGHQVIANSAEILGIATVSEAMLHGDIRALFLKVTMQEIAPHVPHVPENSPIQYIDLVERRFSNPAIVDTIRRVSFDGSSRHPGFVLPSVRDARARGAPVEGLALVQAAWARMCVSVREDGSQITPNDPFWKALVAQAQAARDVPQRWLLQENLYGDLAHDPVFSEAFGKWLKMIYRDGIVAAIQLYVKGD